MALNFNGTTHQVNYGQGANIDNLSPATFMFVFNPSTIDSTFRYLLRRSNWTSIFIENPGSNARISLSRAYAGTNLLVNTTGNLFSTGNWYVAFFVDGGSTVAPRIYYAQIGNDLVEPSYGTQNTPTSTLTDDSADDCIVGLRSTTLRFVGDISDFRIYSEALSLGQCKAEYRKTYSKSTCELLSVLGFNGTGSQADWSGNGNAGTVTGATVADHAPIALNFGGSNIIPFSTAAAAAGRIMSSLANHGGLAGKGGIAGIGGGLAG